ncbi:MAG TPA: phosphoribosylformylglycinamidine cyclo-ligase [Vicinamibacterales bacterium]|jgi:phosphoribosylformylglycinamidine cyclo-ligase|nr:phosphoribosylformylglycinamidine cyclo-ligase [Vicinamibacterales bacterium]
MDYKQSGVDIESGDAAVRRIRNIARATFTPGVLSEIGSFGGMFRFPSSAYTDPILVSSADGVGTKLKIAFMSGIHDTVGADLVNHCVNDILVHGAEPMFFLDYLATGRLDPEVAAQIVSGMGRACTENGCALIGGETAEMPGFYQAGEYDLAGFIVGVVDKPRLIDGRGIQAGDWLIGLPSTGLHTNGYSLARQIVFETLGLACDSLIPEVGDTVAGALLRTHRSYLKCMRPVLERGLVKGMAHITGGGIPGNLARILPEGVSARIQPDSWTVPPLFAFLQRAGGVPIDEMYRAFNMGIGLILACAPAQAQLAMGILSDQGEAPRHIGAVVAGNREVMI